MSKSKPMVCIYGEWFEVIRPRKHAVEPVSPTAWDYATIYDAYQKPSKYKVDIWKYWYYSFGRPFDSNEVYRIGVPFISSRNCFAFTVVANVYDAETFEFVGVMEVTKDNQRIYFAD